MLRDFNLLISTTRGNEADVCSEVWYLLGEIGDEAANVDKTGVSGLAAAKTSFPPLEALGKLREMLRDRPYDFRYSLRIIPIQEVTQTDLDKIRYIVTQLASEIQHDETFRVTVEKRFTHLSTKDIVEAAAANIDRKVDLTNPDKIILIEVIGGLTGVSVLNPSSIISVVKEKVTN
ncbi:MAG: THUMP domain-containing protein [Candidatus Bathyarchaeota archaeon]|nr:MAG: THUMP domain-containing protein [Candidatus Bathyarchaeota archaeon]